MIRIIEYNDKNDVIELMSLRKGMVDKGIKDTVESIIDKVVKQGDSAVRELTEQFDGVRLESFEIDQKLIEKAYQECDPALVSAMERACENITAYHEHQKQKSWMTSGKCDIAMGQRIRAMHRVGVYVPGGTAAYPSTVLMNVIPAKVAGVKDIVMVTPPSKDGKVNVNILAAAKIAGINKIYSIGGAQAVAALAVGTKTIPKVDKIVGPGNIFVATAKRLLYGIVDIDMIAGPSEVLIIADENANEKFIAADMMAQAEHDPMASSVLLCFSREKAEAVKKELSRQIKGLSRHAIITQSIEKYGAIVICKNIDDAIDLANEIAPEHLEVMLEDPMQYLDRLNNAGSIFLGDYCPEPLGDYFAGPNHVLPTSGTARFFSPLSVDSFIKKTSFIYYSDKALNNVSDDIQIFAKSEGLDAHANSIKVRFKNK